MVLYYVVLSQIINSRPFQMRKRDWKAGLYIVGQQVKTTSGQWPVLYPCCARFFLGENERYVWRYNSIPTYITMTLNENLPSHIQLFADLEGHKTNGQTIPQDIIVTSSRPDLVLVDSSAETIYLFELTTCFETADNIQNANRRKYDRSSNSSAESLRINLD